MCTLDFVIRNFLTHCGARIVMCIHQQNLRMQVFMKTCQDLVINISLILPFLFDFYVTYELKMTYSLKVFVCLSYNSGLPGVVKEGELNTVNSLFSFGY